MTHCPYDIYQLLKLLMLKKKEDIRGVSDIFYWYTIETREYKCGHRGEGERERERETTKGGITKMNRYQRCRTQKKRSGVQSPLPQSRARNKRTKKGEDMARGVQHQVLKLGLAAIRESKQNMDLPYSQLHE